MVGFSCPYLGWFFVYLGVFCCWHNSVSPKSCMPYFFLVVKPLSFLCLNLLSSSDLKLVLLLGWEVQCFVSRSVIRALDTLYSVLHFVVAVWHLFFCESSGLFQFNSFSKLGFFRVFFLIGWSRLFWVLYTSFYLLYALIIQTC